MQEVAKSILSADAPALLALVDQLVMAGRDMARFVTDLAQHFRNILICRISDNPHLLVRAASSTIAGMQELSGQASSEQLVEIIKGLSALLSDLRWAADARTALEIGLIRLMDQQDTAPVVALKSGISPKPTPAPVKPVETVPVAAAPIPEQKKMPEPVKIVEPAVNMAPIATPEPVAIPEPAAAPDPDDIPLPEPPPEIEAAYVPETPAADPFIQQKQVERPAPVAGQADVDATGLWQKILDYLLAEGQMTLYLFGRSGRPQISGSTLQVRFEEADRVNFEELNQAGSIKIMRSAIAQLAGHELEIKPILTSMENDIPNEQSVADEDDWISKIKKTADTLGIPVKMEE